jgi:hypothetical protein
MDDSCPDMKDDSQPGPGVDLIPVGRVYIQDRMIDRLDEPTAHHSHSEREKSWGWGGGMMGTEVT